MGKPRGGRTARSLGSSRESPAHVVQLYDEAAFPAEALAQFIWDGLSRSGGASVILTPEHSSAVRRALRRLGADPVRLVRQGRLLVLDARETASQFMRQGLPDRRRFEKVVCARVDALVPPGSGGRMVGEMVGVLMIAGNPRGALALERLWGDYLARRSLARRPLALRCLYPISLFANPTLTRTFHRVMDAHHHVVPVLDGAAEPGDTGPWIARLQQQTRALQAEVQRRKYAERSVAASRRQLRALGRHLVEAGEEERAVMSRRIHDELGQALTALHMDMERLRRRLNAEEEDPRERLLEMMAAVEHLTTRVQQIAVELRPAMLDDLGLPATLEWVARSFQDRTGVTCKARVPQRPVPMDRDRVTAIYRVAEEALANVARHARASMVDLVLAQGARGVDLVIRDDGVGINHRRATSPTSLGLTGMRERAQAVGGRLSVSGTRGGGTTVRMHLPAKSLS